MQATCDLPCKLVVWARALHLAPSLWGRFCGFCPTKWSSQTFLIDSGPWQLEVLTFLTFGWFGSSSFLLPRVASETYFSVQGVMLGAPRTWGGKRGWAWWGSVGRFCFFPREEKKHSLADGWWSWSEWSASLQSSSWNFWKSDRAEWEKSTVIVTLQRFVNWSFAHLYDRLLLRLFGAVVFHPFAVPAVLLNAGHAACEVRVHQDPACGTSLGKRMTRLR